MAVREISLAELSEMEGELKQLGNTIRDIRRDLSKSGHKTLRAQTGTVYYHISKLKPMVIAIRSSADRALVG